MRSFPHASYVLALACLVAVSSASAQTNDHLYRGWSWQEDVGSARAAGMAGAFSAVADDPSAAAMNPAGLVVLKRSEVNASLMRRGSGSAEMGDSLAARTGFGFLGAARPFGRRWVAGAFFEEPRAFRMTLAPTRLPDNTWDAGFLDTTVRDAGASVGFKWTGKLRLGAGVSASRVRLEGADSRVFRRGPNIQDVSADGESTRLRGSFGVLYDATPDVRLGLVARTGATWTVHRSAASPLQGIVLDPGSDYALRAPDVFTGGVSYRLRPRILLAGQLDYVRYSQVRSVLVVRDDALSVFRPEDYTVSDAVEGRAGIEWSFPVNAYTIQARGGIHSQAPGSITYEGSDAVEAATFPSASRRLLGSFGASLLMPSGLMLDGAAVFGGRRTLVVAGARYRF